MGRVFERQLSDSTLLCYQESITAFMPTLYDAGYHVIVSPIGSYMLLVFPRPIAGVYFDKNMGSYYTYSGDAAVWEYWNGSTWAALTVADGTDATAGDGKRPFQQAGRITWTPPANWTWYAFTGTYTGGGGDFSRSGFMVRCRVTGAAPFVHEGEMDFPFANVLTGASALSTLHEELT